MTGKDNHIGGERNLEKRKILFKDTIPASHKEIVLDTIREKKKLEELKKEAQLIRESRLKNNNPSFYTMQSITPELQKEYDALMVLYNSTDGDNWTNNSNWGNMNDVESWHGVTLSNGHVYDLDLHNNNLNGYLPEEIGDLTSLVNLRLHENNSLTGEIPFSIGNLTDLVELQLEFNNLTGEIPSSIGNLTDLGYLGLAHNELTGELPDQLQNLESIFNLYLGYNELTDEIPEWLGGLNTLLYLGLGGNNFHGEIPSSLGNLSILKNIILKENNLEGEIPEAFGDLTNINERIDLSYNQLSGPVPESLSNLTKVEFIYLENNQLSGPFPSTWSSTESGFTVKIDSNQFTFSDFLAAVPNLQSPRGFTYDHQSKVGQEDTIESRNGSVVKIIASIDNNTNSTYTWFRDDVPLSAQAGLTISDSVITIASMSAAFEGTYTYKITNGDAPGLTLESNDITLLMCEDCGIVANINTTQTQCGVLFQSLVDNENDCDILSYLWDFGDEQTSTEASPIHAYEQNGTYDVELRVESQCGEDEATYQYAVTTVNVSGGTEDPFENITLNVPTQEIDSVLAASATTFSDAWPLEQPDEALTTRHSFLNGSQGVWRTQKSYVYDTLRESSPSGVNLAVDGTVKNFKKFNWQYANVEAIPNWLPANAITKYSPYSYELENKDVLGRYASALYNFDGQLPQAIGQNMQHEEMAFTSFEFNSEVYTDGNWRLGQAAQPAYHHFNVLLGMGRIVLVKAPLSEFNGVDTVDVMARGLFRRSRYIQDNPITCSYTYEADTSRTVLVFERPVVDWLWFGEVMVTNEHNQPLTLTLDDQWAHSGDHSLKISSNITLEQDLLSLTPDKEYILSTWVSIQNMSLTTPTLGSGIGIQLIGKDKDENVLLNVNFQPSGPIIEGWQKLEGKFKMPPGEELALETTFLPGTAANVWFDDVRIHPVAGNMQSYVYELDTYRLSAVLDENLYASFYYYDQEGKLYLVKKETEAGLKTINEAINHQVITNPQQ